MTKQVRNPNAQTVWDFENWDLIGIWGLDIGIYPYGIY